MIAAKIIKKITKKAIPIPHPADAVGYLSKVTIATGGTAVGVGGFL